MLLLSPHGTLIYVYDAVARLIAICSCSRVEFGRYGESKQSSSAVAEGAIGAAEREEFDSSNRVSDRRSRARRVQ